MILPEIKQRAVELLKKGYSAGLVLKQLQKDFPEKTTPNERTINRWKNDPRNQQSQGIEPSEIERKTPRKHLIANDALYEFEKKIDFPQWAKNALPPK